MGIGGSDEDRPYWPESRSRNKANSAKRKKRHFLRRPAEPERVNLSRSALYDHLRGRAKNSARWSFGYRSKRFSRGFEKRRGRATRGRLRYSRAANDFCASSEPKWGGAQHGPLKPARSNRRSKRFHGRAEFFAPTSADSRRLLR